MKNIRSIYSENPGIRLHSLRIHRVRVNRHLPEARWIADHRHAFSQILLYLGGSGWQVVAGQTYAIGKGQLFLIPPGVSHSFLEPVGQKPLCLALDFEFENIGETTVVKRLNSTDLVRVRQALSGLTRWRTGHEKIEPGEASEVLRLVDVFFRALDILRPRSPGTRAKRHRARRPTRSARLTGVAGAARQARPSRRLPPGLSQPRAQAGLRPHLGRNAR